MHAYRFRVAGQWREFDLRPLTELPPVVIRQATKESLMWDVFAWGMVDYLRGMLILDIVPMRLIRDLYAEWQKDSRIEIGEIMGLMGLIEKHGGPLEADLIKDGLRLRDCPSEHFNWRDLWVYVTYADVNSRIVAASNPDIAGWTLECMLLANVADDTAWLHWAKTKGALEKSASPPELIPRPGVKRKPVRPGSKTKPITIARARELAGLDKMHEGVSEKEYQRRLENAFR
jgi:hypothetical protein